MTRKTVQIIEDDGERRPDYDGTYYNSTYHNDGTVSITIPGNADRDIADAIQQAETLDELKNALLGELTNAQVKGRRTDNSRRQE